MEIHLEQWLVGKKSGFFNHFEDLLFEVTTFAYPATWLHDDKADEKEQKLLLEMKNFWMSIIKKLQQSSLSLWFREPAA